jgi:PAS domain-containing protein
MITSGSKWSRERLPMNRVSNRESQGSYHSPFENMTQAAFRQRADGTLVDVNAAALRIFGLTRDEFFSRTSETPAWDVICEDGALLPGTEHPSIVALRAGNPVLGAVLGVRNERTQDRIDADQF